MHKIKHFFFLQRERENRNRERYRFIFSTVTYLKNGGRGRTVESRGFLGSLPNSPYAKIIVKYSYNSLLSSKKFITVWKAGLGALS
jgi:hypothetical protein